MAPPFDPVNKIYLEREAWRLKVRIVRLWTVPAFNNASQTSSVEIVLLDEYGGKIQASIKRTLVYKFLPILTEGGVYRIVYFTVVPNTGCYRATTHDYRLLFQIRTTVSTVESELIPLNGLSLIPFSDVYKNDGDSDFLVDVIGLLAGVSNEKQYERDGKMTKMVVMELMDGHGKIECALFGDYVEELNAFLGSGNLNKPVVVVQLAKIKLFRGNIVIQNVMHATKLMFNPDIAEAIEFRNGFAEHGLDDSQPLTIVPDSLRVSIEDDFMKLHVQKTIQQLSNTEEEGNFIVLATINGVVEDADWWYPACKCHRAVKPDSGLYYCDSCFCHVLAVTPRYRIKVNVEDESGCAVFVLFDHDAQCILQKSCLDLVAEVQKKGKYGNESLHPAVLEGLVGKKILFKVENKKTEVAHLDGSYRVKRVCEDDSILTMFLLPGANVTPTKAKFTPPFPDICNLESDQNDSGSVDTKDFVSQLIASPTSLGSVGCCSNANLTPAKRTFNEAMTDGIIVIDGIVKMIKKEPE